MSPEREIASTNINSINGASAATRRCFEKMPFSLPVCPSFNGKLLVILKANRNANGKMRLASESKQSQSASVDIAIQLQVILTSFHVLQNVMVPLGPIPFSGEGFRVES